MKVLLSAYACDPYKGSEPGVGWNWINRISKFAEVWVVTRANNKGIIEKYLEENPNKNLHFIYVDLPRWARFWKKGQKQLYIYYFIWQILTLFRILKLSKKINFDLAHHVTFGNFLLPTFLPLLKIPFIWGPIGGGELIPKRFWADFSVGSRIRESLKVFLINSLKWNPLYNFILRKAELIITKTSETAKRIPNEYRHKVILLTDCAIEKESSLVFKSHIILIGSLVYWRGFNLAIKAYSLVQKKYRIDIKLIIVGDGPERRRLEKLVKCEKLANKVYFKGYIKNREKLTELMRKSKILINPCLKEGGVTVIYEALSIGLPIITFDVAGTPELLPTGCLVKVKLISPEKTTKALAKAIINIINNYKVYSKRMKACKKIINEFYNWDKKGEQLFSLYKKIISKKNENSIYT